MQIRLKNIQAFVDEKLELPDKGLVQILGENSNGKSILGKIIKACATLEFTKQGKRETLIRDGEKEGFIVMEYKGKVLSVVLNRDRNQCYVTLRRTNDERVTRTIRDGGIDKLMYEFGFRVYDRNNIVLQLHETFGIMPFVNSSDSANFEIVEDVTTDTVAQQFVTSFKEVTYKRAREVVKEYTNKIETIQRASEVLVMYDYAAYADLAKRLMDCYSVCKYLMPLEFEYIQMPKKIQVCNPVRIGLQEIHVPKAVSICNIPKLNLQYVKVYKPLPMPMPIEDVGSVFRRARDLSRGKCPTCGKRLNPMHSQCVGGVET